VGDDEEVFTVAHWFEAMRSIRTLEHDGLADVGTQCE